MRIKSKTRKRHGKDHLCSKVFANGSSGIFCVIFLWRQSPGAGADILRKISVAGTTISVIAALGQPSRIWAS